MKIKLNKNEIRMKHIKMEVKLTTKSQWWLKRKAKYRERTFLKNCSIRNIFLQCFIAVRVLESVGDISKILDHKLLLTETDTKMLLENSCTFYDRQIIPPNIILWKSS